MPKGTALWVAIIVALIVLVAILASTNVISLPWIGR